MISCQNLTKIYDKDKSAAIKDLCIQVEENTVFGFLGPNGAGKTTTIKILTGLMSSSYGTVVIDGEEMCVTSINLKRKIGYLGQEPKMYSWMKGKELLLFVGKIFGLAKEERENRAVELLEMSGLKDASDKKISSYSGGMTQRLGIAQAMMGKPKVLFLDEPTSALDPIGRKEVLDFILKIKESCTVFMSTHILSDVERVCDTVAIIDKGKVLVQEKTDLLKKRFSQRLIEIELETNEEVEKLIKEIETKKLGEVLKTEESIITIHPFDFENDKKSLLVQISKMDVNLERFEVLNASLEDVFVKLIGGQDE